MFSNVSMWLFSALQTFHFTPDSAVLFSAENVSLYTWFRRTFQRWKCWFFPLGRTQAKVPTWLLLAQCDQNWVFNDKFLDPNMIKKAWKTSWTHKRELLGYFGPPSGPSGCWDLSLDTVPSLRRPSFHFSLTGPPLSPFSQRSAHFTWVATCVFILLLLRNTL